MSIEVVHNSKELETLEMENFPLKSFRVEDEHKQEDQNEAKQKIIFENNEVKQENNICINVREPCLPAYHELEGTFKVVPIGKPICDQDDFENREFSNSNRRIDEIKKMKYVIDHALSIIHDVKRR